MNSLYRFLKQVADNIKIIRSALEMDDSRKILLGIQLKSCCNDLSKNDRYLKQRDKEKLTNLGEI